MVDLDATETTIDDDFMAEDKSPRDYIKVFEVECLLNEDQSTIDYDALPKDAQRSPD